MNAREHGKKIGNCFVRKIKNIGTAMSPSAKFRRVSEEWPTINMLYADTSSKIFFIFRRESAQSDKSNRRFFFQLWDRRWRCETMHQQETKNCEENH